MSEQINELMAELRKSKAEFDIAATCVAQALKVLHERLDKVELWITEDQKPQIN